MEAAAKLCVPGPMMALRVEFARTGLGKDALRSLRVFLIWIPNGRAKLCDCETRAGIRPRR
jgi:hypothetical protein